MTRCYSKIPLLTLCIHTAVPYLMPFVVCTWYSRWLY